MEVKVQRTGNKIKMATDVLTVAINKNKEELCNKLLYIRECK